jgi:hypothetical protein
MGNPAVAGKARVRALCDRNYGRRSMRFHNRKVDLNTTVTAQQWNALVKAAVGTNMEEDGFDCQRADEIALFVRPGDAPGVWRQRLADLGAASGPRQIASFRYNGGRPVARLAWTSAPAASETASERNGELEEWVLDKWRQLLRKAGSPLA